MDDNFQVKNELLKLLKTHLNMNASFESKVDMKKLNLSIN